LAVLLGVIVIPPIVGGTANSASGIAALAILAAGIATAWELRLRRMGIRIEADSVVAVYAVGRRRFPTETVAGFSLHVYGSSGGTRCVFIELVKGKRRIVPSVCVADWGPFKSDAIQWDSGQTTDVVTFLNDQLAAVVVEQIDDS
jgi:hypothetical protein